jgi:hypothetical protein
MTRMRCLHCGRMVPLGNFKTVNEARCVCGTFLLEPSKHQRVSVPHVTDCEVKPGKTSAKQRITVNVEEECSS